MMVSTKGRYALRVLIDLAEREGKGFTPLREIIERQEISQKYLESIMAQLSKAELVEAVHGKGGGYRLARAPEEITLGDVLRVTEGSLAPVACLEEGAKPCERATGCRTLPVWTKLDGLIRDFVDGITIRDLAQSGDEHNREGCCFSPNEQKRRDKPREQRKI